MGVVIPQGEIFRPGGSPSSSSAAAGASSPAARAPMRTPRGRLPCPSASVAFAGEDHARNLSGRSIQRRSELRHVVLRRADRPEAVRAA